MIVLKGVVDYLSMLLCGTLWTKSFGHVVDAVQSIPLWKKDGRYRHVFDAEGAVAAFAVEMHVLVVVMLKSRGTGQLIQLLGVNQSSCFTPSSVSTLR